MKTLLRSLLLIFALLCAPVTLLLSPNPAVAQQSTGEADFVAWEKTALRAENAIETARASTRALGELRKELREWRQKFRDEKSINAKAITTVLTQLSALGPVPESGTEVEAIAQRREELNQQLKTLREPSRIADLAYGRATGLILGIDQIIRERKTTELIELGPSPLNPSYWGEGLRTLYGSLTTIKNEFTFAWDAPVQRAELREDLPVTITLILLGMLLMIRGRSWSEQLARWIQKGRNGAAWWILSFLVSIGEMLLPLVGVVAFVAAMYATGLVGLQGDLLLPELFPTVFMYLLSRWVSTRIFPRNKTNNMPLNLNTAERRSGRLYGGCLGAVIAAFYLLTKISEISDWTDATHNVVLFPVLVIAGLLLSRISRLLMQHSQLGAGKGNEEKFRERIARILSRVILVLAVVGPALAAIGYFKAAQSLMMPSLFSLLLLGVLLILQMLISEVYILLSGNKESASDSLIPVLAGMLIVLLAIPAFAIIWGARVTDITELWMKFNEGVYLGDTQISPQVFLSFALIFSIGYMITRLFQGVLRNAVLPKTKMDLGGRHAVVSGVGYLGIFLAGLVAITTAGIDLSSIAIVAGALSVGIGFGLQTIVSNFVSGIILLVERPISEGDWIEVGGQHGIVRDISVRSTRIETFDRSDVIIPNADLVSGTVVNYTRGNTVGRVIVPVGVAYGTDTRLVEKVLLEIAEAHPMVLANPAASIVFREFGASSMDFEIRAILRDVNWVLTVQSDMNHEIARRFAEEGIEIPFEQRDIWIRNPEAINKPQAIEALSMRNRTPAKHNPALGDDIPKGTPDADE